MPGSRSRKTAESCPALARAVMEAFLQQVRIRWLTFRDFQALKFFDLSHDSMVLSSMRSPNADWPAMHFVSLGDRFEGLDS
jgi:hypothetical protein